MKHRGSRKRFEMRTQVRELSWEGRGALSSNANYLSLNPIESRAWGKDWRCDPLPGRKVQGQDSVD